VCSTRVNLNDGIDGTRETTSALRMLRADVRGLDSSWTGFANRRTSIEVATIIATAAGSAC